MEISACEKLLNIEIVSGAFKEDNTELSEKIISCFYSCYCADFIKWATAIYQQYPPDMIEFIANNSFTDAVLKLKDTGSRGELYSSKASLRTVLFHFFRNMLMGHLAKENRLAEKNNKLERHIRLESNHAVPDAILEEQDKRYHTISQALARMPASDRQIIQWRHFEERSNDEIAGFLAITVASATNRIYRCMQRLRELVEEIEKNSS